MGNTILGAMPYFVFPLILSFALVPLCKWFGLKLNIYAVENSRTVHQGKIVRIGGLAIYLAFMIAMAFFVEADNTWNGIIIGGTVVFFTGLIDDCLDIRPIFKLLGQGIGAIIAITVGGISLDFLNLPFGITIDTSIVSMFVTFIWIVGITNAINLLDGLDGLASGISFIVLCTIGIIGFLQGRRDICIVTLILAGANLGFLRYNFQPASVFMGDCGALFLGYLIACISLLGFKSTAFISLGIPIIILFVPISDTLVAIVRRKLSGKRFSEADRSHLHHILMYKLNLGHRKTVLTLYSVTLAFSFVAVLNFFSPEIGIWALFIMLIFAELFIETTGMINYKFHPLIGLYRRITGYSRKRKIADKTDN